ncbi:MAG: hypothetical protein GY870_17670, partial [archaeon]|nr:hypothetical protein [archaeon]
AVIFTEDFFELGHYISSSLEIRRKDELISDIITEMDVDGILKEQIIIETNSTPLVFNLNIAYIRNNNKIKALKNAILTLKNEFQSLLVDSYLFQIKEYAI